MISPAKSVEDYLNINGRLLPKANSHVHANGMATNDDVLRLAAKYGIDLSMPPEQRDYLKHIHPDGKRDWAGGHHAKSHIAYDETVSLIKKPEDLYDIVRDGLIRDARHGCLYTRLLSSGMNNWRPRPE